MLKQNKSEKGQALVLIVFAIIGMVALVGLAMDGGQTFSDRRQSQNAADGAALVAALTYQKNIDQGRSPLQNVVINALSATQTNGYSSANSVVTVVDSVDNTCPGGPGKLFTVTVVSTVKTWFAPVVGVNEVKNTTTGTSRACPPKWGAAFNGAAVVALKETGRDTFIFNGGAKLHISGNSGIMVNSNTANALRFDGNSELETNAGIVSCNNGTTNFNGGGTVVGGTVQDNCAAVSYRVPADLPTFPAPPATPTCSGPGDVNTSTRVITPGNISGTSLNGGAWTMGAGTYCFSGDINIQNNSSLTITGLATMVFNSSSLNVNNGSILNGDGLIIYQKGGQTSAKGTLHTLVFRFYGLNGGVLNVDGTLISEDAHIYNESGQFPTWNGNATINLTAPTSGPYAGLVYYQPFTNTNRVTFNGGSTVNFSGTFFAPGAEFHINGNTNFHAWSSQIIGYTVSLDGNNDMYVNYDASKNIGVPFKATIELVK